MRRILLVLLVALSSGCTFPQGSPSDVAPSTSRPVITAPETAVDVPSPTQKTSLAVSLRVADRWVRPSDTIVASASAPDRATVGWFLAPRNPDVPGEENYEFVPRSLSTARPGSASLEAKMADPGRYAYAAKGLDALRFNVTVVPGMPDGGFTSVFFVEDAWGARFAPSELTVGKGASVTVRNHALRDVEPVRVEQMIRVAPDGPNATITPPVLLGDYDLVALARDGGDGWGAATARLIVDSRKPDATVTMGPWSGTFALAPAETPDEYAFESRFNYSQLSFAFNTSSSTPGGASVRVTIVDANGTTLATKEGASGDLVLSSVPSGAHGARVELVSGVQVSYHIAGAGELELVPPASFFAT